MAIDKQSYVCSTSPIRTFAYEKIRGPRPPQGHRGAAGATTPPLRCRDPRKPLSLDVRYLGQGQDVWEIRTRGWRWQFSGAATAGDVLRWINSLPGY